MYNMSQAEDVLKQVHKIRVDETYIYSNFEKHYRERGFVKASEFLWGSVGKIAYATGLLYGKKLGGHGELVQFMRDLAEEKERPNVRDLIGSAEALHANFYHNWMPEEIFEEYVRKVIELRTWLIERLEEKIREIEITSGT